MRAALLACLAAVALQAQVATVYVDGPRVRLIAGEQVQLSAAARDRNGEIVSNASFQWSSSDQNVVRVDGGSVTAAGLGIADVFAAVGSVRGAIRLQVLPQRIEVAPADLTIAVGSQQQYTAAAYDANDQPIPNVNFTWHVMVFGGFDSTTVSISRNGIVSANTLGTFRVRAAVTYAQGPDQFEREFSGSTGLTVAPAPDYNLALLASSDYTRINFGLRGRRGAIAANDAGLVTLVVSLDGISNGLLQLQDKSFRLLASGAAPGVIPGTLIADFDDPAMNSRGDILIRAPSVNQGANILLINGSGVQVLVPDQAAADVASDVNALFTNRFSLAEDGQAVVRGNFHYDGSTDIYPGIFRAMGGGLFLEASAKGPLPGLSGTISFDDQFGIDGSGVIYFTATAGSARAVYRKQLYQDAVRIIGTGDALAGSRITAMNQIAVAAGGDLFLTGTLASGTNFLARLAGSSSVVYTGGYYNTLFSAHSRSGLVFSGDPGTGFGLYLWSGSLMTPLLLRGRPSPSGEPVQDFYSATIDSNGAVYATMSGVSTPWMLAAIRPSPVLLATVGTPVAATANLNFSTTIVPGDRTGGLHLTAGGNQASIVQADSRGVYAAILLDDKLPGGGIFAGNRPVRKSASGVLYVSTDQATYAVTASSVRQVIAFPIQSDDGVASNSPFQMSVNDAGVLLFLSNTSRSHQRLIVFDGKTPKTIAYFQGAAPFQTASPSGGIFSTAQDHAVNEAGQVMLLAQVSGGPGGLFLYDGTAWQPSCLIGQCQLGGEAVTSVNNLRAAGNRFCASFNTRIGNFRIACYESGAWVDRIKRGDITADGTELNSLGTYDLNRNGDVAFVGFTGMGGPSVFVKRGDRLMSPQNASFPMPDGSFLRSIYSLDLRDDARLFFTAMDFNDRLVAYEADPR